LKLEAAGASAVVLPSLFEEEIELEMRVLDHFLQAGSESYSEALNYFPKPEDGVKASDVYLQTIRDAKASAKIPIIGSLNGATPGGWIRHATMMEEAGVDALELNLYYVPSDPRQAGHSVETQYLQAVQYALSCVSVPVAVKIGPYFSSLPFFARELAEFGVRGIVMFNRFYQPDINLETLEIESSVTLSRSEDLRLPLRWTAILSDQLNIDIAITTGVHTGTDVIKSMMAGAKVTMLASELLEKGVDRISGVLAEIESWMQEKEYDSIQQMQGSMRQHSVPEPAMYERANYMKVLHSFIPKG
jgi:dihydroorotate dehydrogenase (fumarate)